MPSASKPALPIAIALATAFLAGEQSVNEVISRAIAATEKDWRWFRPLARRYVRTFAGGIRPRHREVVRFLLRDKTFRRAHAKYSSEFAVKQWLTQPQRMHPVAAVADWDIPAIESVGALCDWLELDLSDLEWFADLKGLGCRLPVSKLQHYNYKVLTKRSGDIRLIEAPKPRLKEIQRRILRQILEKIPLHPSVHGFCKGRSIKTFTLPHAGRDIVLRMDIRDFFPSFHGRRIQTFFRTVGYPESVADLLGGICTNTVPGSVWNQAYFDLDSVQLKTARDFYRMPHLPQGAPTSPALANLCAYRIDCRLSGLATASGVTYTRYADDLAFSGDASFVRRAERFSEHIAAVLLEEGFHVHHRKTRIMNNGMRQYLAGLVINEKVNIARKDFDLLKAILTNCIRFGPESQNRCKHPSFQEHLGGRISFVEMIHPDRGARLRKLFEQIQW